MSGHTPGPWRTGRGGTVVVDAQHDGNHRQDKADLEYYGGFLLAESIAREADARLMAAAPDMAEALLMVRDADEDCKRDGLLRWCTDVARQKIDAALAKAGVAQ